MVTVPPIASAPDRRQLGKHAAIRFVVFLGVVSLFADMTYEGGRSITGPFLELLGASATVVGIVAGAGELLGYGLRFFSGRLSDRTGRYWTITIAGYVINLFAVPLLALAGSWQVAIVLMMLERTGKAIRNPARDAMLAHATREMGRGWGFGLHEAMDQTGALIGPLIVALVLHHRGEYPLAFGILVIPAVLSIIVLLGARHFYPRPSELEVAVPEIQSRGAPRRFWLYLGAAALVAAGYADYPLIAYHFAKAHVLPAAAIPVLYAVGMGAAAVAALAVGRIFDRVGLRIVVLTTIVTAFFPPLVFFGGATLAVAGMVLWGFGLGVQESVVRAALAGMVPTDRRAGAYGTFDTGFGIAWFVGSAVMGVLYDRSVLALVIFSVAAQIAAIPLLMWVARLLRARPRIR